MATVTVSFTYNPDAYPLLHQWLEALPKRERSQHIRHQLESSLKQGGNGLLEQILSEVQAIRRQAPQPTECYPPDGPVAPDILGNLGELGK